MKVLIVSTNRETLPDPAFPLGPAYVAAALVAAGHDVETLDLCFLADKELEKVLSERIEAVQPHIIGLSLRNVDDSAYPKTNSYLDLYQRIARACRAGAGARSRLVIGGAGFTIMPRQFLELLDADYGVIGEGEVAFCELCDRLENGQLEELPAGVIGREGQSGPRAELRDDWSRIIPARSRFAMKDYYERGGMLSLQTRRGCPFRCSYCTYPMIEGHKPRLRSIDDAMNELEVLVDESDVRHLFIVDSVFNYPRDYAMAFCDELIARKLEVKWTCYATPGHMDGELIERMREAGCEGVEFGTDGLVDEMLENLEKGFTFAQVEEASRLCRELGLRFCHFLFLGSPGEDLEQTKLGLDRLAALEADSSLIMVGIRIFPGTALAKRAVAELGIDEPGLEPVFYVSPKIINEVDAIVERVIAEHSSWVLPGYRRNFNERIQRIIRGAGKKGVLWDFLSPR